MDLPLLTVSYCYNHCVVNSSSTNFKISVRYNFKHITVVNLICKIHIQKHFVRHMRQKYLFRSDIMTTIQRVLCYNMSIQPPMF